MSTPRHITAAQALAAVWLTVLATSPHAAGEPHYYDGSQRRVVTLQPGLIAEFSRPGESRSFKSAYAGATALAGVGDDLVRIYRLPKAATRSTATAPAGSPVYREGNSPAGRLIALPGGVLVKFKADWTREHIDAWLSARGLSVERKLAMEGNWFKIGTPPGNASLATANAIFESGEVLAASPNWWKQTVPR
jgi:hypothetical protein